MLSTESYIFFIVRSFFSFIKTKPSEYKLLRWIKYKMVFPFYNNKTSGHINPFHSWIIRKYIHKGFTVIDVGANRGDYSARFLKIGAKVVAFEPGTIFEMLVERFKNCKDISLSKFALGNKNTEIILNEYADKGISTATKNKGIGRVTNSHRILCRKLDAFHLSPQFIKIDTQGMDYEVILGAKETLERCKPIVLAEYDSELLQERGYKIFDMLKFMDSLGYNFQTIQGWSEVTDILFIPKEKK
ncbi:MAG: FkbM family methyltransferase [Thermoplasmata archaeon]|nr:FkbM family methyltransferase [Thermoplasmata archaeon]